jgi:hypothetical protein
MWSAQYLCNPTPIEGGVLKAEWLHYWHPTNEDPAKRIYKLPPQRRKSRAIPKRIKLNRLTGDLSALDRRNILSNEEDPPLWP